MNFVLTGREQIAESIKRMVGAETSGWGVEVEFIKIQEFAVPQEMKRAEAERERRRHPGHPKRLGRLHGRRPQDGDGLLGELDRLLISAAGGVGLKEARSIVVANLV